MVESYQHFSASRDGWGRATVHPPADLGTPISPAAAARNQPLSRQGALHPLVQPLSQPAPKQRGNCTTKGHKEATYS